MATKENDPIRSNYRQSGRLLCTLVIALSTLSYAYGEVEPPDFVEKTAKTRFPKSRIVKTIRFDEEGIVGWEVIFDVDGVIAGVIVDDKGAIAGQWREGEEAEEEAEEEWPENTKLTKTQWRQQRLQQQYDPAAIERAIKHLAQAYPNNYPHAADHLAELSTLEPQLSKAGEDTTNLPGLLRETDALKQKALIANNPLIDFDQLVFIKRYTYQSSHFYTDFIDGCHEFGGQLCILDLKTNQVRDLLPAMSDGIFGRFDLSFDARTIVFDWKKKLGEGFRIYEVGVDGQGLRQLTFPPADEAQRIKKYDNSFLGGTGERYQHHTDDMHPCYLPDGGICFTSSRCEYGTLCDAPDILSSTILHRMDADGTNMEKLTNSSVSEFSPTVMSDGRILYTRWEYIDKGQLGIKCLWAMRPDGAASVEIYGNDIPLPPTLLHGRQIPGHTNLFVALGTPHYPQSGIGTVLRIDTNEDIRTRKPMTFITPHVDIRQEEGWNHKVGEKWIRHTAGPLYMDPFPLSDKFFLVSHNSDRRWNHPSAYAIYLLDEFGNHTPIYADDDISCWQPMPLKARRKPRQLPIERDPELAKKNLASCIVQDIYRGMEDVEPGTIKYLRIMEQVPRPWASRRFWDQQGHYGNHLQISAGGVLGLKVTHGIVPVYEDGSAHFLVPADKNIYLQARTARLSYRLARKQPGTMATHVSIVRIARRSDCVSVSPDAPRMSSKFSIWPWVSL